MTASAACKKLKAEVITSFRALRQSSDLVMRAPGTVAFSVFVVVAIWDISCMGSREDRQYPRIETPRGVWVAWGTDNDKTVSRVSDLNVGGLFISTPTPLPVGSVVKLLLTVPEGEIRAHAVVRNSSPNVGMGVQFTAMGAVDLGRLDKFVKRLLAPQESRSSKLGKKQ